MAGTNLDTVANEILDTILEYLLLDDVRNVRLVNKEIAEKRVQGHFKHSIRKKNVDFTRPGLKTFVQATSEGRQLGRLVEYLTIVGVVNDIPCLEDIIQTRQIWLRYERLHPNPPRGKGDLGRYCTDEELLHIYEDLQILKLRQADYDDMLRTGEDVALLSQSFRNIATGPLHGLRSLRLGMVVHNDDATIRHPPGKARKRSEKLVFERAVQVFSSMVTALSGSALSFKHWKYSGASSRQIAACCMTPSLRSQTDTQDFNKPSRV